MEVILTEKAGKSIGGPSHKERKPVWLDPALHARLVEAAKEDGRPLAWLARDMLEDGLRRRKPRRKPEEQ